MSPIKSKIKRLQKNHIDQKWFRNLVISQIIVETMNKLNIKFPDTALNIEDIRKKYHRAVHEEKKRGKKKR